MLPGPLNPKKHYVGTRCGFCHHYLAFVEDPSAGKVKLVFEGPLVTLTCQSCGRPANYPTAGLHSFRGDAPPLN
jgi:ribosomal protein S27E